MKNTTARILITCPDKPGIVAAVTNFLYSHGVNITTLDQHSTDPEGGVFFMRLEFQTPHMDISRPALEKAFEEVLAERFHMDWRISYAAEKKRMAVLVSRHDHAMIEILWRWSRGELDCEIATVISNHPDMRPAVEGFGVDFVHIPVTRETREKGEQEMLALLEGRVDLIVLARYMQVLSPEFVSRYPNKIINIHHSFLPAFIGADPYRQAYQRGVKIIGATAHYVTADLDEGPIIEQDVTRVSHRFSICDLKDAGRDLERQVLARAVRYHLEDRIIVYNNTTFVFATR
jgi:formyltetrahydrofolate deformylase